MNKYFSVAAGLMVGVTLMFAAVPAMARVNVDVNIGVPAAHAQPHPVYVQPRPVYVQPAPVYMKRPHRRDWIEREWHARRWHEREVYGYRDRDRDGVPNRYDRRPDNRYRY